MAADAGAQSVANPSVNIAPSPNFFDSGNCYGSPGSYACANPCVSGSLSWPTDASSPGCDTYVLGAINAARGALGESALVLPSNWFSLSAQEQLFVIIDMERVGDGATPILGINTALSTQAMIGAQGSNDPTPAPGFLTENGAGGGSWGSVWAQGYSPLVADYLWMYEDGWSGATTSNISCTSATSEGCWGHRDIVLGVGVGMNFGVGTTCTTCEIGVGYAPSGPTGSWTALIEVARGTLPPMTFTWAQEAPYFSSSVTSPSTISVTTIPVTTIPVTTTTQAAPVAGLQAYAAGIGINTARVHWSLSSGVSPHIVLMVYKGTSCVTRAHSVSVTWSGPGVSSGNLTSTGTRFYTPVFKYSAVVSVSTPTGSLSSGCIQLGQG
jgi:hypothetical protein